MGPPAGKTGGLILYQFNAIRTEEEKVYLRFDSLILLVLRRKRMSKSVPEIVQKIVQKIKPLMKSPSNKPVQRCPQASQAGGRGFESHLPLTADCTRFLRKSPVNLTKTRLTGLFLCPIPKIYFAIESKKKRENAIFVRQIVRQIIRENNNKNHSG